MLAERGAKEFLRGTLALADDRSARTLVFTLRSEEWSLPLASVDRVNVLPKVVVASPLGEVDGNDVAGLRGCLDSDWLWHDALLSEER